MLVFFSSVFNQVILADDYAVYPDNQCLSFYVTSDGTTGPQWISRLEGEGFQIDPRVKQILLSSSFRPTRGVRSKIVVINGLESGHIYHTDLIWNEAAQLRLLYPNPEVACLIRERFSDEQLQSMGLTTIYCMHRPIKYHSNYQLFMGASTFDGGHWLTADDNDCTFLIGKCGFAFVAPQMQAVNY